ncbi:hypothetical protein WR25_21827 [Diploscapter pachys]|uniref:MYND-type domain-containing protein n=1 Tax=Diploscapter pachys TaxID=2018661 RepID=A0A2A2L847_9BILA|nr:hypothetical protein WR25_21827 [Diploscapter pachys]
MELMAEELPYVAVVKDELLGSVCSSCFKESTQAAKQVSRCSGCKVVSYCSKACQKRDWTDHKPECISLTRMPTNYQRVPHVEARFIARIAWKRARGDEGIAYNGRKFTDLMNHRENIEKNAGRMEYFVNLSLLLADYMGNDCPSRDALLDIFGKVAINAYSVDRLGRGLYIGISIHDHSCAPDMEIDFDGPKMILRALKEKGLKYNKDLRVSYINAKPPKTTEERQEELKRYFFRCTCERCQDEERNRIVLSVLCKNCSRGVCPVDKSFEKLNCKQAIYFARVSPVEVNDALGYNAEAALWHKRNDKTMNFKDVQGCRRLLAECLAVYEKCSPVLSHLNLHLAQLVRDICMLTVTADNPKIAAHFATLGLEAYDYHFSKCDIEMTARYQAAALCLKLADPASLESIKLCKKTRDLAILSLGPNSPVVAGLEQDLAILSMMRNFKNNGVH